MQSSVSLIRSRYFFPNSQNFFTIPVSKSGTANCSVSVFLGSSSYLHPSGIQYVGIEQVLQWLPHEEGIKYAKFEILPTAHKIEYIGVGLKNFLRCQPQNISQTIVAIGEPSLENYPTIFGGLVTLTASTMQREVSLKDDIYTTTYIFPLPGNAILGEVRTQNGEYLSSIYKRIVDNPWHGIVKIMDNQPIEDASLQIHIVSFTY